MSPSLNYNVLRIRHLFWGSNNLNIVFPCYKKSQTVWISKANEKILKFTVEQFVTSEIEDLMNLSLEWPLLVSYGLLKLQGEIFYFLGQVTLKMWENYWRKMDSVWINIVVNFFHSLKRHSIYIKVMSLESVLSYL